MINLIQNFPPSLVDVTASSSLMDLPTVEPLKATRNLHAQDSTSTLADVSNGFRNKADDLIRSLDSLPLQLSVPGANSQIETNSSITQTPLVIPPGNESMLSEKDESVFLSNNINFDQSV